MLLLCRVMSLVPMRLKTFFCKELQRVAGGAGGKLRCYVDNLPFEGVFLLKIGIFQTAMIVYQRVQ